MNLSPRALELVYAVFGPQSNTAFPAGVAPEVLEIRRACEQEAQVLKAAQQVEQQPAVAVRRGRRPRPANDPVKE